MSSYLPQRTQRPPRSLRRTKYFPLIGAIDLVTQEEKKNPGTGREAVNFEPGIIDGFRRIDGYEVHDGRDAPSDATWYVVELSDASDRSAGQTLTGTTSGASGEIVLVSDPYVVITKWNSTSFQLSEATNGTGTVAAVELAQQGITGQEDNYLELLAQNEYRSDIGVVPGSGDVRGAYRHLGKSYSFRDNSAGTYGVPHYSSSSGWTALSLYHLIKFDAGTTDFEVGETINASGASTGAGTLMKIEVLGGAFATNDAQGIMVINITSGFFVDGAALAGATSSGAATQDEHSRKIQFFPGGRTEWMSHNFYANNTRYSIYGCDGANMAFEIDANDVITPIPTNANTQVSSSDFSAGVDGWTGSGGTAAGNIDSIDSSNDWLRLTLDSADSEHYLDKASQFTSGKKYRLRFEYFIPGSQSNVDGIRAYISDTAITGHTAQETTGSTTTVDILFTAAATGSLRLKATDGGSISFQDAGGDDLIYVKNVVVEDVSADVPKYLTAHRFHLMLAIGSSLMISKIGEPFDYSGGDGAIEVGLGATITGLKEQPGGRDDDRHDPPNLGPVWCQQVRFRASYRLEGLRRA